MRARFAAGYSCRGAEGAARRVEGLHFHVLCESRPEHLRLALDAVEKRFGRFLDRIKWLNMGGGHLMTHKDYDCDELIRILQEFKAKYPNLRLILEPAAPSLGGRVTWFRPWRTSLRTAACVRRCSTCRSPATCPTAWRCPINRRSWGPRSGTGREGLAYGRQQLSGRGLLRDWIFDRDLRVGDRIVFEDMIHYTMVKTTMFNGVAHPAIAIVRRDGAIEIIREFGYEDFKSRMS